MSADVLIVQFHLNHHALKANLEGLSHADSLKTPRGGGNCLNWVLGHVLASRDQALKALGAVPRLTDEEAAPYRRGAEPLTDPERALPLERLVEEIDRAQETLLARLRGSTAAELAADAPFSLVGNDDETLATLLGSLAFHEAYHVGQTGILRRQLGHDGALT